MTENDQSRDEDGGATVGNGEPMWIMDATAFGRRIRSIRIDEGFDRAEDFTDAVFRSTRVLI